MFVSFLPPGDTEFDHWFQGFATTFTEKWQAWGFTDSDWKMIEGCWALWHKAFSTKSYEASTARSLSESAIVGVVNQLCSTQGITESDWNTLGIDGRPSLDSAMTSSPALFIENGSNGNQVGWNVITHPVWNTIELQWRTELGEWQELSRVSTAQTPVIHEGNVSNSVQYRGRWVSSSNAFGPWSAIGCVAAKAA